jgi:hypothetical protein
MFKRSWLPVIGVLAALALISAGCAGSTTTVTAPAQTVVIQGGVTTLPAVTVTVASGVTTLPATTVTVPLVTATLPTVPAGPNFLPTTPVSISYSMGAETNCLSCHGVGTVVQVPLPPVWIGSISGQLDSVGVFNVTLGSIQDHSGRTNDQCLTCHDVY